MRKLVENLSDDSFCLSHPFLKCFEQIFTILLLCSHVRAGPEGQGQENLSGNVTPVNEPQSE